jgi:hypothetical protein
VPRSRVDPPAAHSTGFWLRLECSPCVNLLIDAKVLDLTINTIIIIINAFCPVSSSEGQKIEFTKIMKLLPFASVAQDRDLSRDGAGAI